MNPLDAALLALRAERADLTWWTAKPAPPALPADYDAALWDDSETTTARRRRDLDEAAARMERREGIA